MKNAMKQKYFTPYALGAFIFAAFLPLFAGVLALVLPLSLELLPLLTSTSKWVSIFFFMGILVLLFLAGWVWADKTSLPGTLSARLKPLLLPLVFTVSLPAILCLLLCLLVLVALLLKALPLLNPGGKNLILFLMGISAISLRAGWVWTAKASLPGTLCARLMPLLLPPLLLVSAHIAYALFSADYSIFILDGGLGYILIALGVSWCCLYLAFLIRSEQRCASRT
jgi:hypothetical protein